MSHTIECQNNLQDYISRHWGIKRLNRFLNRCNCEQQKYTPEDLQNTTPSLLIVPVRNNLISIVHMFINYKLDVNYKDDKGNTLLHLAVARDNLEMVMILLDNGANINCINNKKYTLLHLAVIQDNQKIVALLLTRGINKMYISMPYINSKSMAAVAIEKNNAQIFDLLWPFDDKTDESYLENLIYKSVLYNCLPALVHLNRIYDFRKVSDLIAATAVDQNVDILKWLLKNGYPSYYLDALDHDKETPVMIVTKTHRQAHKFNAGYLHETWCCIYIKRLVAYGAIIDKKLVQYWDKCWVYEDFSDPDDWNYEKEWNEDGETSWYVENHVEKIRYNTYFKRPLYKWLLEMC